MLVWQELKRHQDELGRQKDAVQVPLTKNQNMPRASRARLYGSLPGSSFCVALLCVFLGGDRGQPGAAAGADADSAHGDVVPQTDCGVGAGAL